MIAIVVNLVVEDSDCLSDLIEKIDEVDKNMKGHGLKLAPALMKNENPVLILYEKKDRRRRKTALNNRG